MDNHMMRNDVSGYDTMNDHIDGITYASYYDAYQKMMYPLSLLDKL